MTRVLVVAIAIGIYVNIASGYAYWNPNPEELQEGRKQRNASKSVADPYLNYLLKFTESFLRKPTFRITSLG